MGEGENSIEPKQGGIRGWFKDHFGSQKNIAKSAEVVYGTQKQEIYTPAGLNDAIPKPASADQIPASEQNVASTIDRATEVHANTLPTTATPSENKAA